MRFALNKGIPNNYAFFEPESRLHVTISNPVDTVDRVTTGIENALKSKTIISLDEIELAPPVPVVVPVIKEEPPVVPEVPIEIEFPATPDPDVMIEGLGGSELKIATEEAEEVKKKTGRPAKTK